MSQIVRESLPWAAGLFGAALVLRLIFDVARYVSSGQFRCDLWCVWKRERWLAHGRFTWHLRRSPVTFYKVVVTALGESLRGVGAIAAATAKVLIVVLGWLCMFGMVVLIAGMFTRGRKRC